MIGNYVVTALRHLVRHKLFTLVNILGLAIGLAIYLFAQIIAEYERSYDAFFPNAGRTYALTEHLSSKGGGGLNETTGVHLALGPLLESDSPNIEAWARGIDSERLVRSDGSKFYQYIKFVEPAFLDIFEFEIVAGDTGSPLSGPESLMISETSAEKYFGDGDPIGQTLTLDNQTDLIVTAVFRDLPANSHFANSLIGNPTLQMLSTTETFANMTGWDSTGSFDGTSNRFLTYLLLSQGVTPQMLQPELDAIYETNMPEDLREMYIGLGLVELTGINTFIWQAAGLPLITTLQVLGIMILFVACLNYANLATAQVMGRTREVGLRRTVGAGRGQLFSQFIVESIVLAFLALLVAVSLLDFMLPIINEATDRAMTFNYIANASVLARLLVVALVVGLVAGSYPAMIISKGRAVALLNNENQRGKKGAWTRSIMIVLQFTISIFMVVAVAIIYAQNQKIEESAASFDRDTIITLGRISRPEITERWDALKNEIERIDGVEATSFSRLVPYIQSNINSDYNMVPGDEATEIMFWRLSGDENYLDMYDFDLLMGRTLDKNRSDDFMILDADGNLEAEFVNVVVNQTLVRMLGLEDPADAIGFRFYQSLRNGSSRSHQIVGVVGDKNFMGFHNAVKPTFFTMRPDSYRLLSVRLNSANMTATLSEIEAAWDRVNPDYPMERRFLDDYFDDIFGIFNGINSALAIFASIAVLVASIGLFGLAAFMAQKRTKEIGIRKVLGASVGKIAQLLVWQFSRPVIIAIVLAAPLGYLAAGMYLDFFADRVGMSPMLFIAAGGGAMALAAITVSFHAIRAARQNPVLALRYE